MVNAANYIFDSINRADPRYDSVAWMLQRLKSYCARGVGRGRLTRSRDCVNQLVTAPKLGGFPFPLRYFDRQRSQASSVRFALQVFQIFDRACGKEQALVYRHQIARSVSTPMPKLSHQESSHLRKANVTDSSPSDGRLYAMILQFQATLDLR